MARVSTKTDKNIYQQSREECHMTRAQASEAMAFITESQIERIEYGKAHPHPEDVLYPFYLLFPASPCTCESSVGRLSGGSFPVSAECSVKKDIYKLRFQLLFPKRNLRISMIFCSPSVMTT